ncbi:MAG: B12-binding domain-containing radical SAM protein [Candidatus Omnitrophica bacterium]|nr:B12-binding domain-containing radical SAM protein [Candidatus Omnitrophota bacterium]
MTNNIVLLNVKSDQVVYPLGLLYVGSALKRAGFDVKIYNILPEKIDENIDKIIELNPLFVGLSVFTGIHTAVAVKTSERLKQENPSLTIVWGGIHPSLIPGQCLLDAFVDIVVMGEGEETVVDLAQHLKNGSDLGDVKGIGFKSKDEIVINQPRPLIKNLDDFRIDWSLIDLRQCIDTVYTDTRYMGYMSSRGCPFNCGFCYNRAFNKRKWRSHSFEHVAGEIMDLKQRSGINGIVFFDDNFMVDVPRAIKILRFLKENGIKCVRLEMRLDILNEEILNTIYELGVRMVFVGWESGSNRMLKLIDKRITREEIIDKFRLFSRYPKIGVSASSIIGFPTETWQEICQTIDLGLEIAKSIPFNIITFQTFLPYPGTDMYQLAIKQGHKPPKHSCEWGGYNTFYGDMKLEWLPWANKETARIFYRIDKYGKLLNHAPSTTLLRTLGKKICYYLSRFRLHNRFFFLPFEIFLLHRFNRYYMDSKGRRKKR